MFLAAHQAAGFLAKEDISVAVKRLEHQPPRLGLAWDDLILPSLKSTSSILPRFYAAVRPSENVRQSPQSIGAGWGLASHACAICYAATYLCRACMMSIVSVAACRCILHQFTCFSSGRASTRECVHGTAAGCWILPFGALPPAGSCVANTGLHDAPAGWQNQRLVQHSHGPAGL